MNDAQLDNLLREAAQTSAQPAINGDLAGQVRRRYFRHRRTIRLGGLFVVALLACIGIYSSFFILHPSSYPNLSPALSLEERIERLNQKLDQLETKIHDQGKTLAQMIEYQKARCAGDSIAAEATDYGMALRQRIQSEQVGYMLVGLGEDFLAQSQPAEAAKNFEKVVNNFPGTAAAAKAKIYLAKLGVKDQGLEIRD
jgi:TolA-binding protein